MRVRPRIFWWYGTQQVSIKYVSFLSYSTLIVLPPFFPLLALRKNKKAVVRTAEPVKCLFRCPSPEEILELNFGKLP
jgi:hypothetical protein